MKEILKKAYDSAQNEIEEKQLVHYKQIIKNLLEKKKKLDEDKSSIESKIKIIKQDIDDFKEGRLDLIKERHETSTEPDKVAPIKIVIINDNTRITYPTQPWRWNYTVGWGSQWSSDVIMTTSSSASLNPIAGITNAIYTCDAGTVGGGNGLSGQAYATFASGTYDVGNGDFINLK